MNSRDHVFDVKPQGDDSLWKTTILASIIRALCNLLAKRSANHGAERLPKTARALA